MENCDYFIVTDDFLLIKFINDGWKEFDLQQFVEHDIRKHKLSTSEKKKLLTKVIKNIKKEKFGMRVEILKLSLLLIKMNLIIN